MSDLSDEWEQVGLPGNYVHRLRVEGGWLYRFSAYRCMVFVPDAAPLPAPPTATLVNWRVP